MARASKFWQKFPLITMSIAVGLIVGRVDTLLRIQAASTFNLSEVVDMERGTTKRSTRLVNDTPVNLHLYYVTSNNNAIFRKTLHPKPSVDNDADVETSTDTGVTTVRNGVEQAGVNTYIEEFDSNNTYARLRLWDEKQPVASFDTDQLIDNRVIIISMSADGSFTSAFTPRDIADRLYRLPAIPYSRSLVQNA